MRRPVMLLVAACALCTLMAIGEPQQATAAFSDVDAQKRHEIHGLLWAGEYEAALAAIETWLIERPDDGPMLYNQACALAQLGRLEAAERQLMAAVRAGFRRFSHMRRDRDLKPLRQRQVLRAILMARDAADGIYGQRRIDAWQSQFEDDGQYTIHRDQERRIDLALRMNVATQDSVVEGINELADHLANDLFKNDLRHSILIAIGPRDELQSHLPHETVHGVYRHGTRELVTFDRGRALQHELVHAYHHAHMDRFGQQHPLWVQEGLAALYESIGCETAQPTFRPNNRDVYLVEIVHSGSADLSLQQLIAMPDASFESKPRLHYAWTRAVFFYLADRKKLNAWYDAYVGASHLTDPLAPETSTKAFEQVFEKPLAEINLDWQQWLLDRQFTTVDNSQQLITQSVLAEAESDKDIREVVRDLQRRTQAMKAELAYDRARPTALHEYSDAVDDLQRVIEIDPDHADARYDLGLALLMRGDSIAAQQQADALRELDVNLARLLMAAIQARMHSARSSNAS